LAGKKKEKNDGHLYQKTDENKVKSSEAQQTKRMPKGAKPEKWCNLQSC
jgi:hypothetical protein